MIKTVILLLLFSHLQTVYAKEMYQVNTERLNVRESPNAKSSTIGYLLYGINVEVLDSTNLSWYKIKANNGAGYVNSSYLVKVYQGKETSEVTTYNMKVIGAAGISIILIITFYYLFQSKSRKYALTTLLIAGLGFAAFICYSTLIKSLSVKELYTTLIKKQSVNGLYVNTKGGIYQSFNFKGENTVSVRDGIIGLNFAAGYIIDGDVIRVTSNSGDVILNYKDENTLIGEGYSAGTYKKANQN